VDAGAKQACKQLGLKYLSQTYEDSVEKQISQIEQARTLGVNAVVTFAQNAEIIKALAATAKRVGVILANAQTTAAWLDPLFGAEPSSGGIEICGTAAVGASISNRIQLGAAYVPVERHRDGILLGRSIRDNISLPDLGTSCPFGLVDDRRNDASASHAIVEMGIKASGIGVLAGQLSGGNQQKVVLAKWLTRGPRLLVLDNPTRGVDAGAKEEIYRLMRAVTAKGCGILLITDDLVELIELSNRIFFMRSGKLSGMVVAPAHDKPIEHDVIHLMV
jgi:ribose transport system ATP-binding protein